MTMVLTSDINQMVSGVCSDLNQMSGGVSGALKPITEFCDLVPSNYLPLMPSTKVQLVQGEFIYVVLRDFLIEILIFDLPIFSHNNCVTKTTSGNS